MRSFKSLLVPLIIMVLLVVGVIVYFIASSSGSGEPLPTENVDAFVAQTGILDNITVAGKGASAPKVRIKVESVNDFSFSASYEGDDKDPSASYSDWSQASGS